MGSSDPHLNHRDSPGDPGAGSAFGVEEIGTASCWTLIETHSLGRLAVQNADGRPDVFPLNYLVHDGNVFIRSAPGTKLRSIASHPDVALEIDGTDSGFHWSVVLRGEAKRMDTDSAIEASGILALESTSPTPKRNYVRVTPESVTGRRFRTRTSPASGPDNAAVSVASTVAGSRERTPAAGDYDGVRESDAVTDRVPDKPVPIPHVAPWGGRRQGRPGDR